MTMAKPPLTFAMGMVSGQLLNQNLIFSTMVTVIEYVKRQSADGKEFFALILSSDIEFLQSAQTGNFYATSLKAGITTTFPEAVCKGLIGKQLPGEIQRVEVEPFEFLNEETGEVVVRNHRNRYNPRPNSPSMEDTVFAPQMVAVEN